jgi:hypothetical protein
VRVEHQDVGAHQHRVHEQAGGHVGIGVGAGGGVLVHRGLVGMGAVEHALAGHAGQEPGQLGDLGDVGLAVEGHALGVQPGGQPAGGDLQRGALDACRVFHLDQRVVVGQKVEALDIGAQAGAHRRTDGADIVAQMGGAGGGDAGQETRDAHGADRGQAGKGGMQKSNGCQRKIIDTGSSRMSSKPKVSDISGRIQSCSQRRHHQRHHDEEAPGLDPRHQLAACW